MILADPKQYLIRTLTYFLIVDSIVWCSPKAVETAIYGSLNMCPSLDVTTEEAMHLVNIVFLGTADTNKKLNWSDVLDKDSLSYVESGYAFLFNCYLSLTCLNFDLLIFSS